MVIGFNKKFVPKIIDGTKKSTIRENKGNRYKVGSVLHMATGVRTKQYNCFKVTTVKIVHAIWIRYSEYPDDKYSLELTDRHSFKFLKIWVGGRQYKKSEILNLIKHEGFESIQEFTNWFQFDYDGTIIFW